MRQVIPFLLIAQALLVAPNASAAGRRFRDRERPSSGYAIRYERSQPLPNHDAYRAWANERYPKYIGGIHVRELDRFGLPPGDRGLRGNGFYATPW